MKEWQDAVFLTFGLNVSKSSAQNDDMLAYIQNAVDGFKQSWQTSVTDDVNAVESSEFAYHEQQVPKRTPSEIEDRTDTSFEEV